MFARRYFSLFPKLNVSFKLFLQSLTHKTKRPTFKKTVTYSPLAILLSTALSQCDQKEGQGQTSELQQLTMPQLVQQLHEKPSKEFVVIIYDKFKKNKNPELFASQLKNIVEQCRLANIHKIYTINSKNADYLRDIVRRLKNESAPSEQSLSSTKENLKTFQCFFKSKSYPEAFELVNSKDYKIQQQVREIRHFEISINQANIVQQLNTHMNRSFNINKSIVVKECVGKGDCVDSFRREVKSLMDSGLLTHKSQEYEFKLVVDYPSGLLNKSTEYTKAFQSCVQELSGKKSIKKDDTYLLRRDILGKQMVCWSDWMAKEGTRYDAEDRIMMFVRPRVHIISKYSTFTDLMWYLRTSRANRQLSLSLNNTQKWIKSNTGASLQVLKLLHTTYPLLNYLIINSKTAGEIFHHVYCDHKYVLFQQSSNSIWNKMFLDLDKLQPIQVKEQREKMFAEEFKPKINSFIDNPTKQDLIVVEKEHQITLQKLKDIIDRQKAVGSDRKERQYILRVCQQRCGRYLKQQIKQKLQKYLNEKVNIYWIDNTCQNIGVPIGDYLLIGGNLTQLHTFLADKLRKDIQ